MPKNPKRSTLNTNLSQPDRAEYLAKKAFFERVLTIYGRHAVMEALENKSLTIHKLHLSASNKPSAELDRMVRLAENRAIEIAQHDKGALSRISRNARQDQGVALDVVMDNFVTHETLAARGAYRIIALDGVTNPQNLGMIIRSCAAGRIDALLLPTRGNAQITPLVIQASAGTLFRLPIIKTPDLAHTLEHFAQSGASVYALDADAPIDYRQANASKAIFVLGNESDGVSPPIRARCGASISIPMAREVESLNVAVTAALIAYA
jgi:23S rRNA (guanosine2251-2'-O)-methyltransferase